MFLTLWMVFTVGTYPAELRHTTVTVTAIVLRRPHRDGVEEAQVPNSWSPSLSRATIRSSTRLSGRVDTPKRTETPVRVLGMSLASLRFAVV